MRVVDFLGILGVFECGCGSLGWVLVCNDLSPLLIFNFVQEIYFLS